MLRGESTVAVNENQLKRLLIVLCAIAVALTVVGAINAFEPLRAGFVWTVEHAQAALNSTVEVKPIQAAWEWAVANDLPQGWAILIGVIIGLGIIAWQTRIGFRNLLLSQAHQAELDRQRPRPMGGADLLRHPERPPGIASPRVLGCRSRR